MRSWTTAPLRSFARLRWRSSDSRRAFLRTLIVAFAFLHPRPLHVSRSRSPRRTGLTVIDVNFV
jgi:hypothetical protein